MVAAPASWATGGLQPEPGPARDLLSRELSRSEYRPSLLEQARDFVFDLVDRAQRAVAETGAFNLLTLTVLAVALAVGLLLLLARLRPDTRAPRAEPVLGATSLTAADHRSRARAASGRQDWDEAVVEAMRAIARDLEERSPALTARAATGATAGETDVRPGSTAREVAAIAQRRFAGHDEALDALARTFEDVVYGDRRAAQADAERGVRLAETLAEATPGDRAGGPRAVAPQ